MAKTTKATNGAGATAKPKGKAAAPKKSAAASTAGKSASAKPAAKAKAATVRISDKPWLKSYPKGVPAEIGPACRCIARRPPGDLLQAICRTAGILVHGQDADLRRTRAAVIGIRRLFAIDRPQGRRARRDHDAERAAIPGRDDGGAQGRLHGGQRQSALYAARARAPAQGFGRRGDRHPGELRDDAAGGRCENQRQAGCRRGDGRPARHQGHAGQLRRAARQEDGAGLVAARACQVSTTR